LADLAVPRRQDGARCHYRDAARVAVELDCVLVQRVTVRVESVSGHRDNRTGRT
jgi:hypothetical protein